MFHVRNMNKSTEYTFNICPKIEHENRKFREKIIRIKFFANNREKYIIILHKPGKINARKTPSPLFSD